MFLSSGKWDILGSTFQNNITNGMNAGHILNANTRRFPALRHENSLSENSTYNTTGVADSIVNMTMSGADSITFNQNTFFSTTPVRNHPYRLGLRTRPAQNIDLRCQSRRSPGLPGNAKDINHQ